MALDFSSSLIGRVFVRGPALPEYEEILDSEALQFAAWNERTFGPQIEELLAARKARQAEFDQGALPHFLPETKAIREGDWKVAPLPPHLWERHVELIGSVDVKTVIQSLNSGANVFIADFEDTTSPTKDNLLRGQLNLKAAVRKTLTTTTSDGQRLELREKTAVLFVRPRGLHLPEHHLLVDGVSAHAALFDVSLFLFHNARELVRQGLSPCFCLPKLESHLEARLWNKVFELSESALGLPRGAIKTTVLIETLPAAFEMDEILYELRERAVGLSGGRRDGLFSIMKKFRQNPNFILPDRAQMARNNPFLDAYSRLLIATSHRRGVHALGGVTSFLPGNGDMCTTRAAADKVRRSKRNSARLGFDGTRVTHHHLVQIARTAFRKYLKGRPNQINRPWDDVEVTEAELLAVPSGPRTEEGLRRNIRSSLLYLAAWLTGRGSLAVDGVLETTSTAEFSRAQLWQWIHYCVPLEDGRQVTPALFQKLLNEEVALLEKQGAKESTGVRAWARARHLLERLSTALQLEEFWTVPCYDTLTSPSWYPGEFSAGLHRHDAPGDWPRPIGNAYGPRSALRRPQKPGPSPSADSSWVAGAPRPRVLLADSDPASCRKAADLLKALGYSVTTAWNGHEALAKFRLEPPDIVLSETVLLQLNGFQLCQKLKRSEAFEHIPFVFLTRQDSVESKMSGLLDSHADDYWTRPICGKVLDLRLKTILQRARGNLQREQKPHLLLVDGNGEERSALQVSLQEAFSVTAVATVTAAEEVLDRTVVDLIVSEVKLEAKDGFAFLSELRASNSLNRPLPFVFLTHEAAAAATERGLKLGADDYLKKSISTQELTSRLRTLLRRARPATPKAGFGARLEEMDMLEFVQLFESNHKTGILTITGERTGALFFEKGSLIDAECGSRKGKGAFNWLVRTRKGLAEVRFIPPVRLPRIEGTTQGLLMDALRLMDEFEPALKKAGLPDSKTVLAIARPELTWTVKKAEARTMLALFDGLRSLGRVIEESGLEDAEAIELLRWMYAEGLLSAPLLLQR